MDPIKCIPSKWNAYFEIAFVNALFYWVLLKSI